MDFLHKERMLHFWAGRLVQKYKDLDFAVIRHTEFSYIYNEDIVSDFLQILKWYRGFDCSCHIYYKLDEKKETIKIGLCFDTDYGLIEKKGYTFFE